MATILYALCGEGRGHTSRASTVATALRERGHTIHFCCGGTAREMLERRGEQTIRVPALRQVNRGNRVSLRHTVLTNLATILTQSETVMRLADTLLALRPDVLVTDFEPFAPRAAHLIGLPVVSLDHQQVITETRYELPPSYRLEAALTASVVRHIAPLEPQRVLITSFDTPPLLRPERTELLAPIIRPEIQNLSPTRGEHVLVYCTQRQAGREMLKVLRGVNASFFVYNAAPETPEAYPNLLFREPDEAQFLRDLAGSRALVCTAGFTLMSEALFLGKPLLVVPTRGVFEQTLNALTLQRSGLGRAVLGRALRADDIRDFLDDAPRPLERLPLGNSAAVAHIEAALASLSPTLTPRPSFQRTLASLL